MRLQKFLSAAGIASRRKSEKLIKNGLVKVNGKIVTELGIKISPCDSIFYRDKQLKLQKHIYIMLNKPVGYVTTLHDEFNRPNILQLVKIPQRIFPIGRLDYNTSGLLLLTNDGELTYKLTHPKHNINKTYVAKIKGEIKKNECNQFENGLIIDGRKTAPAQIKIINSNKFYSVVQIKIHEGRNRQIRKMCAAINHHVIELKRTHIGELKLDVNSGCYRILTENEIDYLKSLEGEK